MCCARLSIMANAYHKRRGTVDCSFLTTGYNSGPTAADLDWARPKQGSEMLLRSSSDLVILSCDRQIGQDRPSGNAGSDSWATACPMHDGW